MAVFLLNIPNVSGTDILQTLISLKDAPDNYKEKDQWLDRLDKVVEKGYVLDCTESNYTDSIVGCEDFGTYAQAYVAGYVARKMSSNTQCSDCLEALRSDGQHERDRLITLMSKGDLIYPSEALFCLLREIEFVFHEVVGPDLHITAHSLINVIDVLTTGESIPLVGCCTHREDLTKRIASFYVMSMGHFVGHAYNRTHNLNREKSRKLRKMAKQY